MIQTEKADWVKVGEDLARLGRDLKIKTSLKVKDFMREQLEILTLNDSMK